MRNSSRCTNLSSQHSTQIMPQSVRMNDFVTTSSSSVTLSLQRSQTRVEIGMLSNLDTVASPLCPLMNPAAVWTRQTDLRSMSVHFPVFARFSDSSAGDSHELPALSFPG